MNFPKLQPAALGAAILSLGLCGGAVAQTATDKAGAMPTPAATTSGDTKAPAKDERTFVEKAATGGMAEVQLGQLAQQKASSDQVKQFGARMAQDHGKANDELKQVASDKGIQLPASLDKKHEKEMQTLQKLSGAEFDREYMKHMVADHKKDISEFEKESKSGKDSEIKDFAAKTLPTLQEHLKLAQSVDNAVKNAKSAARG
jgi:putative membrane protein